MLYVDSHIHLQDYKTQDIKDIVNSAQKAGVSVFVNPSAHPDDWKSISEIADKIPSLIPAFGVHPWHIGCVCDKWLQILEQYLNNYPNAWVGECGIDRIKNQNIAPQKDILLPQIKLSKQYNRPLIIHSVKANSVFTELFTLLPRKTIFHSFTGSAEWGKQIQNNGFFIGLNFSILNKKNAAEIINSLNINQILLETDGPYQSDLKNQETLPQNLPHLAAAIAEMRNIPITYLQNVLQQNWQKFTGE